MEIAYSLLEKAFSPTIIHCTNRLKVRRDFSEACRGYRIGKGGDRYRSGRSPIICMENVMEREGPGYEVSFTFDGIDVCGTISKGCFKPHVYDVSDEWQERFKEKVFSIFNVTEIDEAELDVIRNKTYY